jgi:hypothetical protein
VTPVRIGRYFRLPDCPADLDRIWAEATPLADRLPVWLAPEDAAEYRLVAATPIAGLSPAERETYLAERAELEDFGFFIDEDTIDPVVESLYVGAPRRWDVWSIGIFRGPTPVDLRPMPTINPVLTRDDVTDVPAVFVADPFMVRVADQWHMFFEVLNWRTNKGEIGLATSADGLRWTYRQIVLVEPFHLSYPYVFEWRGEHYLIPESHRAGAVRLYRARPFPDRWEFVGNLLEGPYLADASVVRHGDRWWLFVDASPTRDHDTLRLYRAADLSGPWTEHPCSPIVRGDPRGARPAGRVLCTAGRVIRFGQDCAAAYGTSVWAFEVTELTPDTYRERPVGREPILGPSGAGWNADGMHHVDAHPLGDGDWLACVDGWLAPEGST